MDFIILKWNYNGMFIAIQGANSHWYILIELKFTSASTYFLMSYLRNSSEE